jgi:hypothetical protein
MSVTEGSILMSIAHCDRRIADADSELERLRGRRAARWQEQDQPLLIRMLRRRLEAKGSSWPRSWKDSGHKMPATRSPSPPRPRLRHGDQPPSKTTFGP